MKQANWEGVLEIVRDKEGRCIWEKYESSDTDTDTDNEARAAAATPQVKVECDNDVPEVPDWNTFIQSLQTMPTAQEQ